jgi:hypothetical protein
MVWAEDAELVVKQFPECSRGTAGVAARCAPSSTPPIRK